MEVRDAELRFCVCGEEGKGAGQVNILGVRDLTAMWTAQEQVDQTTK